MFLPQIRFRTCLFHPLRLAASWAGHVHMRIPLGDATILVGKCEECRKWEDREYKINGRTLSNQEEFGCSGCFGFYEGPLR